MVSIKGNLVFHNSIKYGEIFFDQKIQNISILGEEKKEENYITPGFIDLHVHGGGGCDVMDHTSIEPILKTHAKNGTTSLLLTTVTSDFESLKKTFLKIRDYKNNLHAKILGIHLEGPYISEAKLGAQPPMTRSFSLNEIKTLHAIFPIKIITLAPELINESDILELKKLDILIQLGHSNCTYDVGVKSLKNGANGVTHLFNAMSSFHHREPGLVGAALNYATFAEIIPDLLHVHPGAIDISKKLIPKLYFVSDATSSTGMPLGEYLLGNQKVTKCANGVRLSDGTLAGSSITLLDAFNNSNKILRYNLIETIRFLSVHQTEYLNLTTGKIEKDFHSDFNIFDKDLNLIETWINGKKI